MNGPTGEALLFEFLDGYEDGVVLVQDTLHASATFLVHALLKRALQGERKVRCPVMLLLGPGLQYNSFVAHTENPSLNDCQHTYTHMARSSSWLWNIR